MTIRSLLNRLYLLAGIRPRWWLGTPYRITIGAAACGGYVLKLHHTQGTEWLDLPLRAEVYDPPDELEFDATAAIFAARGLVWVLPWELNEYGNLTAPVTAARQPGTPAEEDTP